MLVTLALLAALTRLDCWRQDWLASSAEGWLNLLLPLAWACLAALVVQQESLVGDRQYWITWPCPWQTLLGSKLLFVLLFVHLPSLIADAIVVQAHGFSLVECVSRLLWKQALLAAAITLPALGLATLFETYCLPSDGHPNTWCCNLPGWNVRAIAATVVAERECSRRPRYLHTRSTAVVIVLIQYVCRRVVSSRTAGAGALFFAVLCSATFRRLQSRKCDPYFIRRYRLCRST